MDADEVTEVPAAFVATTVNVYAVAGVNPVTVIVPDAAVFTVVVTLPGDDVAV